MRLEGQEENRKAAFEQLKASEGWRACLKYFAQERERLTGALVSAKPENAAKVAELQAQIRLYAWLGDSALAEIESSETKKEGK